MPLPATPFFVGTAGWSLSRAHQERIGATGGTHLEEYARVFPAVEVNSSFYRPHRPRTWARWAASTPPAFRFSVKIPRSITHERRLVDTRELLTRFLGEIAPLGDRLGPLLVQLPPGLGFDPATGAGFFETFRELHRGPLVVEPRHPTWFTPDADDLLRRYHCSRVAADPMPHPLAGTPGGDPETAYYRLHGSPRIYWSVYGEERLRLVAERLRTAAGGGAAVWCIFDNTAEGHALVDGLRLMEMLREPA